MTCKSCNKVSVVEYEETTNSNYNVTMGVELGCNDALKDVSLKSEGTPHHIIKEALNRLKRTMDYGIPDKET